MNVPQDKLNAWSRFAELTRNTAIAARLAYARGDREAGKQFLKDLERAAAATSVSLEFAGAERPGGLPAPQPVPLALLDTPANRRYLEAVRNAYEAARALDDERGYGEDGPAETLRHLAEEAETEVYGPVGRVRE